MAFLAKISNAGVTTAAKAYVRVRSAELTRAPNGYVASAMIEALSDSEAPTPAVRRTIHNIPIEEPGEASFLSQIYDELKTLPIFSEVEDA